MALNNTTTFTVGKSSHNKNEAKNASLAMKSRQQVINEVNKRRTLLQDNSWIKKRPEEEGTNENYGRVVLNQYKSQDSLHRNPEGKDDEKALLNRYRSDTTLDRIPGRNDTEKANISPVSDSRINKRYQDVDDFIKVNNASKWEEKRYQDVDDFIKVNNASKWEEKRSSLFSSGSIIWAESWGSCDLEGLIDVKDNGKDGNQNLDDFIVVNCTFEPCDRSSGLDSFIEVKNKNNQGPIIEKELCTYCWKPLGTDTKMILEALRICCHATCFKCEICKASLENLEAGDSVWIYKNAVHCSPCYSKVKATWTY